MRKSRAYAEIYNDMDEDAVNVFRVMREDKSAKELRRRLELTPFSRQEFFFCYAQTGDPIEKARRMIARSFMGFGSTSCNRMRVTGFRASSNRSGTTPAHDWAHYPEAIPAMIDRLRGVVIECRPAIEVLKTHDGPDTLHYVDPPYVHSTRQPGNLKNYRFEMTDADHRDLASVLKTLRGGVVLSGYPSPLYDELYGDWNRVERSALADGAQKRTEVLWINAAASKSAVGRLF
jgi:DNA adenine methylase